MRSAATISAIVRARDEEKNIASTLESLRSQSVPLEIVVVDSGSSDATVEIARTYCDELVLMKPADFTFGRALNLGVTASSGAILLGLSAHCSLPTEQWLEKALLHFADPQVAGVCGGTLGSDGSVLASHHRATFSDVHADPRWGYSNHAGCWRRAAWDEIPFDDEVKSCEDKYWMWQVMLASWKIIVDPALHVPGEHRRAAGLRNLWRREFGEHEAIAELLQYQTSSTSELIDEWWSHFPWPSSRPQWQRRLSPSRTVELVAGFLGEVSGRRKRGPKTLTLPS